MASEGWEVLTVADMARELRFDRSTVYRWIHVGRGPRVFRSPGGHLRVYRADFLAWANVNGYTVDAARRHSNR